MDNKENVDYGNPGAVFVYMFAWMSSLVIGAAFGVWYMSFAAFFGFSTLSIVITTAVSGYLIARANTQAGQT